MAQATQISTEGTTPEIRAHKTIPRTAVYWQGDGTYYYIPGLNIWARITCQEVQDWVTKYSVETIEISESDTIKF